MKSFAKLFNQIESTNSTNKKVAYLYQYFATADKKDSLWVIALFSHRRPRRVVTTTLLREWAAEAAGVPLWLFEDTYHIVGDLAETISKILPVQGDVQNTEKELHEWIGFLIELKDEDETTKKRAIIDAWHTLGTSERFLFNKLITGGFRMGVSQRTIVKALAKYLEEEEAVVAHRLMGDWTPQTTDFDALLKSPDPASELSKPYPFYLAYALESDLEELGSPSDWMAEYKWDGIRTQLIKRGENIFLWSRGEELITTQFPEFEKLAQEEIDFVIDGELLIGDKHNIESFNVLQKRLGRKKPGKKILKDSPAFIMAYDIFELEGNDIRHLCQEDRREKLEGLFKRINNETSILQLSENLSFENWEVLKEMREQARDYNAEGLMLKSKAGAYKTGRKKGDWFKWKVDPLTLDVVMIYAQRGHGRRANLFTDFTFAVRDGEQLVTIAKAYSGLTDEEFREISRYVRSHTIERFGPVHSVPAEQVFEIAFEAASLSKRHKSGVALRFPRILRWRKTKKPHEINSLDDVKKLVQ